jgi:hypothetical protein
MNIVEMYVVSRGLLPAPPLPAVFMLAKRHAYFARSITQYLATKRNKMNSVHVT